MNHAKQGSLIQIMTKHARITIGIDLFIVPSVSDLRETEQRLDRRVAFPEHSFVDKPKASNIPAEA